MRGRIYAANDVLNGVGGNEQLANALKVKGPSYAGVNYSPKPLPGKLDNIVPRSGGQIKSTYSRSQIPVSGETDYDPWMRNEQRYRE